MSRKRALTPDQERELIQWWLSIRSVKAKARSLRISTGTIYDVLARHGIDGRKPKPYHKERLIRSWLIRHDESMEQQSLTAVAPGENQCQRLAISNNRHSISEEVKP